MLQRNLFSCTYVQLETEGFGDLVARCVLVRIGDLVAGCILVRIDFIPFPSYGEICVRHTPPPLSFHIPPSYDLSSCITLFCIAVSGRTVSLGLLVYSLIHDSIMPSKQKLTSKLAPVAHQVNSLKEACLKLSGSKLSHPINKNAIIFNYNVSCQERGMKHNIATVRKGEPTTKPINYPTISQLVRECSMKPSLDHQYRVENLSLDNVIMEVLKSTESFMTDEDVANLAEVNSLYREMVRDFVKLRTLDFSELREPRIGYAEQTEIQFSRVDMATVCAIHYSLHPGMVIRYLRGKYVGKNRNVPQILRDVLSHVNDTDAAHIERILTQGCPSRLSF